MNKTELKLILSKVITRQGNALIALAELNFRLLPISNFYCYGGQVYGVRNDKSDLDYIAIIDNPPQDHFLYKNYDVSIYSPAQFQEAIDAHEISALECLYLPKSFVAQESIKFNFELSLPKLRESISQKSSHSFVKARKKLRFGEPYIGKKSMWHAFRIIIFGTQIAKYGKITDYSAANYLYEDIVLNPNNEEAYYKEKYTKHINELTTEFRKLAPKE